MMFTTKVVICLDINLSTYFEVDRNTLTGLLLALSVLSSFLNNGVTLANF